jgi:hypothetical protein
MKQERRLTFRIWLCRRICMQFIHSNSRLGYNIGCPCGSSYNKRVIHVLFIYKEKRRSPQVIMTIGTLGFLGLYGLPLAWIGTCRNWYGKYLFLRRGNRQKQKKQQAKELSTTAIAAAQIASGL